MPIPKPKPLESQNDYISRCLEAIGGEFDDNDQAVAVCASTWRDAKKNMSTSIHEELLAAVQSRQGTASEFNYGILTTDKYVTTLQECVGSDLCYRYAAKGNVSFNDLIKKAARELTYNGPEMKLEDIYGLKSMLVDQSGDSIDLPKNTLMAFRHILSTPIKDRDGDILRTQGARVDPKMLLLWNHVHTLPIGKLLGIAEQSSKVLSLYTAIIDLNELSHDSAVMIDNGMGRFSHGFRALSFDKMKEEESKPTSPGGFDVKDWETLEESLVSVPSNTDADVQDILLSLVEGKQLKSRLMKAVGKSIRDRRSAHSSVKYKETLGDHTQEIEASSVSEFEKIFNTVNQRGKNESIAGSGGSKATGEGCGCGTVPCTCPSKEADDHSEGEDKSYDEEIKSIGTGQIEGSWEYIEHKLREKSKRFLVGKGISIGEHDYVWVIATFKDHAIISQQNGDSGDSDQVYYRASWNLLSGDPEFVGDPKEVKIEVTTQIMEKMKAFQLEKAGRMLSKRNLSVLIDVEEGLKELGRDHISTRSGKVFCNVCIKKLHRVIKAAHPTGHEDEEERSFEVTVKDAMAIFLAKHTPEECLAMKRFLQTMEQLEIQRKQTKEYRALVSSI